MCIKWVPAHRYLDQTRHSVPSGRRGTSCCELDGFILLFHKLQKAEKNFVDHEIEGYKDANGGFLKWWYPTTIGFPTKNDHFRVFWGYHHLRKHPNEQSLTEAYSLLGRPPPPFRHARKSWLGKGWHSKGRDDFESCGKLCKKLPVFFGESLWVANFLLIFFVELFFGVKLEHVLGIKLNTRIDISDMILEKGNLYNAIVGWDFQF